ncbi:uncharacterized protein TNCV_1448951 [Trichonephila clavipes]|nr:uncharacterized protein TNCV_1448951 [Trichonephila clavipes]
MIKNVEFKTPNNEVLQETNLARLYDDMSEKIVKESEDFEGRDSGWTLDEILRLEVRTNRYSPFRGSSFIEVPKQIAETKAIINVINKKDSQCFMWSILAALYPNTSNPNKTSSYVPHLNKLNFDGISFPTPLNEVKKFSKMNDIGINIYSFEEDLKIFPLLISDIVCEKHIDLLYVKNGEFGHYCFIKSLSRLVSKQLSKHQHKTFICKRCLSAFQTEYKLLQHNEMCIHKNPARVVMPSETNESNVGYILEVDLEYPSDLHDKHSDFPLAPENKPPPNCKEPRLLTTLEPKTKYVLHYSNLKLYLKLGDMKEDINLYDTSDYDENNIYNLPLVNKKVIGKMKDENKGNIMTEYVGLKSKMYAYKTNNKIEKRLKGIKKQTIKNKITFEDYKACLFNEKIKYVDMNLIRSKFHSLHSIKQNKLALSYKDDKRFINGDGITTLAHGHWSLMNLDLFNEL